MCAIGLMNWDEYVGDDTENARYLEGRRNAYTIAMDEIEKLNKDYGRSEGVLGILYDAIMKKWGFEFFRKTANPNAKAYSFGLWESYLEILGKTLVFREHKNIMRSDEDEDAITIEIKRRFRGYK